MEHGGITLLAMQDQTAANELFDYLQQYGIFIVRHGEVEAWLPELGITSEKATWTVEILERLGSDPQEATYVRPRSGDVWDFMRQIAKWGERAAAQGHRLNVFARTHSSFT
jgi:hypothetical protein